MEGQVEFCFPEKTRAVSLTGLSCELSCVHCRGHYLRGMASPEDLLSGDGRWSSLLISGGSTKEGRVPLLEHADFLRAMKKKGYRLNLHGGQVFDGRLPLFREVADVVSVDLVLDERTLAEVYGLVVRGEELLESLAHLMAQVRVVPHVTLGLYGGRLRGEREALRALKALGAREVVFLILRPTRETPFADHSPPEEAEVEKIFREAREELPGATLSLGCMRPSGEYRERVDLLALKWGFQKVVMPSRALRRRAVEEGLEIIDTRECCAL